MMASLPNHGVVEFEEDKFIQPLRGWERFKFHFTPGLASLIFNSPGAIQIKPLTGVLNWFQPLIHISCDLIISFGHNLISPRTRTAVSAFYSGD
jgi:hypothetical protein